MASRCLRWAKTGNHIYFESSKTAQPSLSLPADREVLPTSGKKSTPAITAAEGQLNGVFARVRGRLRGRRLDSGIRAGGTADPGEHVMKDNRMQRVKAVPIHSP